MKKKRENFQKFGELVAVETVEKWLPIHAAVLNGHAAVLELLLRTSYPQHLLKKFRLVYFLKVVCSLKKNLGSTKNSWVVFLFISAGSLQAVQPHWIKGRSESIFLMFKNVRRDRQTVCFTETTTTTCVSGTFCASGSTNSRST